jgi:hypothetical protein
VRLSYVTACWGLLYAIYRGYYAFGGTWGQPGVPAPGHEGELRLVNGSAVVILLIAAAVPLGMLPLWRRPAARRWLLVLCWAVAVGCCMHAVIDIVQRVLSLQGRLTIQYPALWQSVDRHAADLQDLYGNEPWFLVEGLLFGALAWCNLAAGRGRGWWLGSALVVTALLIAYGLLAATGVIGRSIVL